MGQHLLNKLEFDLEQWCFIGSDLGTFWSPFRLSPQEGGATGIYFLVSMS